ncbi:MAG: hypothetical protein CMF62_03950 [Magnetococcales bacterium]|nr:hypothetical protein [Magnetococcales bacterium]
MMEKAKECLPAILMVSLVIGLLYLILTPDARVTALDMLSLSGGSSSYNTLDDIGYKLAEARSMV